MRMTTILAAVFGLLAAGPAGAACFQECLAPKITTTTDPRGMKDAARECRETCDGRTRDAMRESGVLARVEGCRAEPMSLEDFRKVRGESPSYHVQDNIFIWDVKNPFPDRVLTKIEVSTQNMDLNELGFTGTGLVPPGGVGTFVIPSFYEGYPAVRFSAKVRTIWACSIK